MSRVRILIVDDERLIRLSLKSMLEELYRDICVIEQAGDGREFLQKVRETEYDLAFLDINMPHINGLDALEQCDGKNMEFCILTGYADFEYAQRAIHLSVRRYLLKPIDIEELKIFMDDFIEEKRHKKRRDNQSFVDYISRQFMIADMIGIENAELSKDRKQYLLCLFVIDAIDEKQRKNCEVKLYRELNEYMEENLSNNRKFATFFLMNREICLVLEGESFMRLNFFLHQFTNSIRGEGSVHLFLTNADNIKELYINKQIILGIEPVRLAMKSGIQVNLSELQKNPDILKINFFCEKMEQMLARYYEGNIGLIYESIEKLSEKEREYNVIFEAVRVNLCRNIGRILEVDLEAHDYAVFLQKCRFAMESKIGENAARSQDVIQKIKDFVEINYSNDVGIEKLGEILGITPPYISRIFRDKTGEKYIDYVTSVRMRKVLEFLQGNPNLSVKEMAEKAGYGSERYFSRAFKKYYGINPSQWMESHFL